MADDNGIAGAVTEKEKEERRARGEFVRGVSACRSFVSRDGSTPYPAEAGRYRLLVARNCPWCHRTLLARALKGLEGAIGVDVCWYRRADDGDGPGGWQFRPDLDGFEAEQATGRQMRFVKDIYKLAGAEQSSVPILWDTKTNTVVNNESAEIVRMLNSEFNEFAARPDLDLYPEALRPGIDAVNADVYRDISNGAYKAGFAKAQEPYEQACRAYFARLDELERVLAGRRFLLGSRFTEADLRLFPTLFRHDPVYFVRMKLSVRMLESYEHLPRYLRDCYQLPGVASSCSMSDCKNGYFGRTGNGVVPLGPEVDLTRPHGREQLGGGEPWDGVRQQ